MTPVKETKEFLDALSALAVRTFNSLSDDGRISVFEGAGYLADLKTVATAISGAPQIPGELLKADEEAHAYLRAQIKVGLAKVGVTHRIQDITEAILTWIVDTLQTVAFIRTAPPTALPA
ncbi:hypothetical protein [Verrucomicrobium spinosum]|uniref:hypothetical protein n=1 Tax=Verrucomicrobium spinosum TaxID=2736 RepID=UPI00017449DA|nr:hypothetical protein [Verrucomicrobium spinosum]